MKLDLDCIRDILLEVESAITTHNAIIQFPTSFGTSIIDKYEMDVLRYHINQCFMSGLLISDIGNGVDAQGIAYINDLSPLAHEFLANTRKDTIWSKTKESAKSFGGASLRVLIEIAKDIITDAIKINLGG